MTILRLSKQALHLRQMIAEKQRAIEKSNTAIRVYSTPKKILLHFMASP